MSIAKERKRILSQLNALKIFGNTATVRKLRKELKERIAKLDSRKKAREQRHLSISREQERRLSRAERGSKQRKYHHYIRMIHDNYPEIPYGEIRRLFKARKEGKEVSIPDVVWQNPSP